MKYYCPGCGTSVKDDALFCPKCGLKFTKKSPPEPAKKKEQAEKKDRKKNSAGFSGAVDFAERYDFGDEDYSREELEELSTDKPTAQRREIMKATAAAISSAKYRLSLTFFSFSVILYIIAGFTLSPERVSAFTLALLDQFSARAAERAEGFVSSFVANPLFTGILSIIIQIPVILICIGMYNFAKSCASLKNNPKAAERPLRGAGVLRKINKFWMVLACVMLVIAEGFMIYLIIWLFSMASGIDALGVTVLAVAIVLMTIFDACIVAFFLKFRNTIDVTELNMRKGNARYLPSKYAAIIILFLAVLNLALAVIEAGKLHSYVGVLATISFSAGLILFAFTLLGYRKELINTEKEYRERLRKVAASNKNGR